MTDMIERQAMAQYALGMARKRWADEQLKRLYTALEVWLDKIHPAVHPYQQAKGFFISGLKNEPWLNPAEFALTALLISNFSAIREEAQQFVDGRVTAPPYGLGDDASPDMQPLKGHPRGWKEWRLYRAGSFCIDRCAAFPVTSNVIRQIIEETSFMMNAVFLILEPGEHLPPHTDRNNIFSNIWLPLVVPDGCYLTVAGITNHLQPGQPIGFNHSYIHSAGNNGNARRVVLSLSVFHPELTAVEREVITSLGPMFIAA